MKGKICGEYTNKFEPCRRRVVAESGKCHYHATMEERYVIKERKDTAMKAKKEGTPGVNTYSYKIIEAVRVSKSSEVSRGAIETHLLIKYGIQLYKGTLTLLLNSLVAKGHLERIKLSYSIPKGK